MDTMENKLVLMGLGANAYGILIGAQVSGADLLDQITILGGYFLATLSIGSDDEETPTS
jgi:hypothetical protein